MVVPVMAQGHGLDRLPTALAVTAVSAFAMAVTSFSSGESPGSWFEPPRKCVRACLPRGTRTAGPTDKNSRSSCVGSGKQRKKLPNAGRTRVHRQENAGRAETCERREKMRRVYLDETTCPRLPPDFRKTG